MAERERGQVNTVAIISITKHGVALGGQLHSGMGGEAEFFVPAKFAGDAPSATAFTESVREFIGKCFYKYDGLVIFISLGAVVRMIAEHLQDKHVDPAVVVVDDRARFAIALLSGHLGGANALTRRVSQIMGAQPVITTASDVGETIAVDLLGQQFGWELETWETVTRVSASVVNEEHIGVLQEVGEPNWWPHERPLPTNIKLYNTMDELLAADPRAALVITDRILGPEFDPLCEKAVVYRPKSLTMGIGSMRGVSVEQVEAAVLSTLEQYGLSHRSIRCLATIDMKRDEAGILEFAHKHRLTIDYYDQDQLNSVEGITEPSEAAQKLVGAVGVCEPAALLSAGSNELLIPKQKLGMLTVAAARIIFPSST